MSLMLLAREERTRYTHHDQLFKELIHTFLAEFLLGFFPAVYQRIDLTSVKTLSEEVFTDLLEGDSRRADIVIEANLKGEDTPIIIHIEPQSYFEGNFNARMYHYFSLLYNKYRIPILPIAVFSYDQKHNEENEFKIEFPFFHALNFNFLTLELRKNNWRDYIGSNNPVVAALLSKMGYSKKERVQVKLEFLRMMAEMELTPAKARLVHGFFEKYLTLNGAEEEELMKQIKNLDEADKILELPISYEVKGMEKEKRKIAMEMLKEGASVEFIAKVTRLDKGEIEFIRKKL